MEAQGNDFKSVSPPKIRLVTWVSLFSNYYNLTWVDGRNMWCHEFICCNNLESSKTSSDLEINLWEKFIMKWQRSSRNMDNSLLYFAIMSQKVAPYWRQTQMSNIYKCTPCQTTQKKNNTKVTKLDKVGNTKMSLKLLTKHFVETYTWLHCPSLCD